MGPAANRWWMHTFKDIVWFNFSILSRSPMRGLTCSGVLQNRFVGTSRLGPIRNATPASNKRGRYTGPIPKYHTLHKNLAAQMAWTHTRATQISIEHVRNSKKLASYLECATVSFECSPLHVEKGNDITQVHRRQGVTPPLGPLEALGFTTTLSLCVYIN